MCPRVSRLALTAQRPPDSVQPGQPRAVHQPGTRYTQRPCLIVWNSAGTAFFRNAVRTATAVAEREGWS